MQHRVMGTRKRAWFNLNLRVGSSITLFACSRSQNGRSMPNALAVFRLMTSSIVVESSIGSSPAGVPRKIRATKSVVRLRRSAGFGS